jgi:site-specific DNA recombinase
MGTQRALIYTRLSRADVLPDGTLDAEAVARQERACRRYCKQRGWRVVDVVADNDVSASRYARKTRPGWDRALAAMEAGEAEVVVATHLDRLTRRPRDVEDLIDIAERTGAAFATLEGSLDLSTDDGRAMARVGVAFAAHYSDATSRRMRSQRKDRALRGDPVRTVDGFGWRDGIPVADEAQAIRDAAQTIIGGGTLATVAREWNARGLKRRRTESPWRASEVRVVLLNPRHAGLVVYRGEVVGEADGPTILDRITWDELNAVMNDPGRKRGPRRRRGFSGVMRCGLCGGVMRATTLGAPNRRARYWSCQPDVGCGRVSVQAEPVEQVVTDAMMTAADTGLPHTPEAVDPEVAAELRTLDSEAQELGEAYGRGDLPMAALLAATKGLEARRAALVDRLTPRTQTVALAPYKKPGALRAAWPDLDEVQRNVVVRALVDAVVIEPANGRRDPAARISEVRWRA